MKLTQPIDDIYLMRDADLIHRYIYDGEGRVVLVGPQDTAHAYLFTKPQNPDNFPSDTRFVYALHQGNPIYLGMIEEGSFRVTYSSKYNPEGEIAKGAAYIVKMAFSKDLAKKTPMRLYNLGVCSKCGQKLESEDEIKQGMHLTCQNPEPKQMTLADLVPKGKTIDDYFELYVL